MAFSLETKTYSIGELLSGPHIFRVPPFQRPFAWTDDIVAQLLDDVQAASERPGQSYFLGPLIASEVVSQVFIWNGRRSHYQGI